MSRRLTSGGRYIDRNAPQGFTFDSTTFEGYAGDTLASALLGAGVTLVGRSFKYHRPRGILAAGPEEPNALVALGPKERTEPNQRATTTELFDGLTARSQNRWPSLKNDVGALNQAVSKFLPAGFYYKTFIQPRHAWKHLFEPIIRRSAGLGPAPTHADPDEYEHLYDTADVLVAGGGVAGLTAALAAGRAGKRVVLVEQMPHWGGRLVTDALPDAKEEAGETVAALLAALEAMPNVHLRTRTMCAGIYDHGYVLCHERVSDHAPAAGIPRHRLWKVRADQVVVATGAIERPIAFPMNDLPGVMLAGAVRDYVECYGVTPGDAVVIVTNNDDAYRTALSLKSAGIAVPAVVDARASADGALPAMARDAGIDVRTGQGVAKVLGKMGVEGVQLCAQGSAGEVTDTIACDAVAVSGGWSPAVNLWSHCGGKLRWREDAAWFEPDADKAPTGADGRAFVAVCGAANGRMGARDAAADAADVGAAAAGGEVTGDLPGVPEAPEEAPLEPVWLMPAEAQIEAREKMWLDFQNDVKVSDVELAAREGFESVEHTKRYTTLGMATDQGKTSNINGLAILAKALDEGVPQVGTTTFRPPWTPLSFGAIVGEAKGPAFQPLRRTPMDSWHEARGATWEPVGHWRRPYCYPRRAESAEEAVEREVLAVRNHVGILDASTLGKILVRGPDAGRFLDMLYTNMMSSLKPGRCRYGLMCSENGFLMDDGVVARIDEQTFLCHTTTGGADRIHAWMEDWLQCEWWDWKVHTANLTEAWGQIAVAGPKARKVLESLGGMDLSAEALPFMGWADGTLGGFDVRVYRISFSGELSFEIAVRAGQARALWDRLVAAGDAHGMAPYGTEALHVLRAEKGFIMIGDESDGTVIPQDLGLDWAISKKKNDYLGKRAQARMHMTDAGRWRLVGLETLEGEVLPDGAYAISNEKDEWGNTRTIGRVTSSYRSPTLNRGIAMALVEKGPERMGEVIDFPIPGADPIAARIVSPVFYDPEGEKQNV
ncbi:sarcosine oxidase subunit alpha family protein [Roseicyclus sp. F158]|uniref:Sarcosine oxidase subunit alpha family protein n=1 Tax=Tropicimonas omnivorans TaxID=3075590 RepID=A0ABU3DLT8_9RHOB|nr:sarcosine oxidase subunit alpha family protein [Roseicyclus sp. F158]MDT0684682.1 sarcosine oxidase subunit alpha family protein [Roseicyclus sp. F158]